MNKPQVNINLNIDIDLGDKNDPSIIKCQLDDALSRYDYVIKQVNSKYTKDIDTTTHLGTEQPTSRHYQAVKASQRITDAIEFINKEIRLLKGGSESEIKTLQEVKRILLDM